MTVACPSVLAPSKSSARRARRFRHAFLTGARCVRAGAPGLVRGSFDSSDGASAVVAAEAVCASAAGQVNMRAEPLPVDEAAGAWTCNAEDVPPDSREVYFQGLLDSLSLGCAAELLNELFSTATDLAAALPTEAGLPTSYAGEDLGDMGDVNPLDAVYEAVAELSLHCKATEADGWVDVHTVDAAVSWAFHRDVAVVRPIVTEALYMWDSLGVMEFRQELSLVKFLVHPELPEKNVEIANLVAGGYAGHCREECRACQLRYE